MRWLTTCALATVFALPAWSYRPSSPPPRAFAGNNLTTLGKFADGNQIKVKDATLKSLLTNDKVNFLLLQIRQSGRKTDYVVLANRGTSTSVEEYPVTHDDYKVLQGWAEKLDH